MSLFVLIIMFGFIAGGLKLYKVNKKLALSLLGFPVFIVVVLACWFIYERNYQFVKSIDLSKEHIGDWYLSDQLKLAGDYTERDNIYYAKRLDYQSYGFGTNKKNELTYIATTAEESKTAKGLTVNQSIDRAIEVYGDSYYTVNDMGLTYYGYVDRQSKRLLTFREEFGLIAEIELLTMQ